MAAVEHQKTLNHNHRKLLPNTKVEVRCVEKGFLGSWRSATVISVDILTRNVRYDGSDYFDFIEVSEIIDGGNALDYTVGDYRGRIRPLPPSFEMNQWSLRWLSYGQCVDMYENGAWWEGVVFDHEDGSEKRMIFFPDSGYARIADIESLRITQDWDEVSDGWQPRGNWLFLEEIEKYSPLSVSVKQIWFDVRVKLFGDLKEWTSSDRNRWKKWVSQVYVPELSEPALSCIDTEFSEVNCKRNGEVFQSKLSKRMWLPVPTDMLPVANLNFDIVVSYCENTSKTNRSMIPKVKGHLLSLGWKFEFSKDTPTDRLRYISPEGGLCYSLREACRMLKSKSEVCLPKTSQNQITGSNTRSPSLSDGYITSPERQVKKSNFQRSKYNLQAVIEYINGLKAATRTRELAAKAKDHLVADGWDLNYVFKKSKFGEGKRELRYRTPDGKSFYSLITACVWYMKNVRPESDVVNPLGLEGIRKEKKRKNDETCSSFKTKHRKVESRVPYKEHETGSPIQLTKDTSGFCTTRMLRSGKRIRLGDSPSNRTPRNVLSLLIENNVVLSREKVYCRGIGGRTVAEGTLTCYGIECYCCRYIFSMSKFVVHAGNNCRRPSANLFLKDGRSLLDCQSQLMQDKKSKSLRIRACKLKVNDNIRNDDICSICHYGGDLLLCDQCPSSFHLDCLGLKSLPEGDWFCPSCCCGICEEHITNNTGRSCSQCESSYHVGCLCARGLVHSQRNLDKRWFCNMQCEKICHGLHQYLGRPIAVGNDGLTWTLAKYIEAEDGNDVGIYNESSIETYNKLIVAIDVLHECFEPVKEPLSNSDIVEDVIFSKRSDLNRLNFHGFYTVLLEKNDEMVATATIRVHGNKVAEVPLIATRFQYRRQGMCRILMDELEKILAQLGVERLVLPAAPSVLETWMTSFGFSKMNKAERLNFVDCTFLDFQGTVMCQKVLKDIHPSCLNPVEGPENEAFGDVDEDVEID